MENYLEQIANSIHTFHPDNLPDGVSSHAKWVIADTIAAMVSGSQNGNLTRLIRSINAGHGGSDVTIVGSSNRATPEWAAFANGIASTSMEVDEGHPRIPGHPASHTLPAALAIGESQNISGRTLLAAFILGYEVATRFGLATRLRQGIHPHGTWGTIGAAASVSYLNGLSPELIAVAISLAGSLSEVNHYNAPYQGADVRDVHVGLSNLKGILCSLLAKSGFLGERDGPGTTFGLILGTSFTQSIVTEGLFTDYEFLHNYIKPHASCGYAHSALDAAIFLRESYSINVEQIAEIEVETYADAARMNNPSPVSPLGAKFSIPFLIASYLVLGSTGPDATSLDALENPKILRLAKNCRILEKDEFSALLPNQRPACVTLRYHGGQSISYTSFTIRGGPDAPLSEEVLRKKFDSLVGPVLGNQKARQIWGVIMNLDLLLSVKELTNLLVNQ